MPDAAVLTSAPADCYHSFDISCDGPPGVDNCKQFPRNGFCDDHGCRDRRPNGRSQGVVATDPHRRRRHHPRPRRGRGDLAGLRKSAGLLHALSALRFPRRLAAAGRRARGLSSLHRGCLRRRTPAAVAAAARLRKPCSACAARASWAASTRPSTWRCTRQGLCRQRHQGGSGDADLGAVESIPRRRAGAAPAAAALARPAEPDGAVAAPALGQRLPAADDGAGARRPRAWSAVRSGDG